jgi:hypothetical protein
MTSLRRAVRTHVATHRVLRYLTRMSVLDRIGAKVCVGPLDDPGVTIAKANRTVWTPEKAHLMARAAQLAYLLDIRNEGLGSVVVKMHDLTEIGKLLERCGLEGAGNEFVQLECQRIDLGIDVDGFIAGGRDLIIVAFCGTEPFDVLDWLTDFKVDPVPGPFKGARWAGVAAAGQDMVHAGFFQSLKALEKKHKWWEKVQEMCASKERPVYFTGHSLGGALALLAAVNNIANDPNTAVKRIRGVYTFGQAMIGNRALAAKASPLLGNLVYRHVNGYDLGPRLPGPFAPDFVHFGIEKHCDVTEPVLRSSWRGWETAWAADALIRLAPPCIVSHVPEGYVIGSSAMTTVPSLGGSTEICTAKDRCPAAFKALCALVAPFA